MADRITWDSVANKWKIYNYSIRYVNGLSERMENGVEKDTTLDMRPIDFDIRDNIFSAMNYRELNEKIEKESQKVRKNIEKHKEEMEIIPGANIEISQPIQMRFNELMTGSRSDIAIKIFGDDLEILDAKATELISKIKGMPRKPLARSAGRTTVSGVEDAMIRSGFCERTPSAEICRT